MSDREDRARHYTFEPGDLPPAELEVLACLWRLGKATARDVRESMAEYRPMTHGAMVTLLRRLEEKELVSKEKAPVGKAFVYRANQPPHRTYRNLMGRIRQRIFGGSGVSMVASLFDTKPPNQDELEALEALVEKLRADADKRGRD